MTGLREDPRLARLLDEEARGLEEQLGPVDVLEDGVLRALRGLGGGGGGTGSGSPGPRPAGASAASGAGAGAASSIGLALWGAALALGLFAAWPADRAPGRDVEQAGNAVAATEEERAPVRSPNPVTTSMQLDERAPELADLEALAALEQAAAPSPPSMASDQGAGEGRRSRSSVASSRGAPAGAAEPEHKDPAPEKWVKDGPPSSTAEREGEPVGPPSDPAPASELALQLAAYRAAGQSLVEGKPREAAAAFATFVERWPASPLRPEAELSWLEARVRSGDHEGAVALARELSLDEGRPRRGDVLRLQADALAHLGRCAAADWAYQDALRRQARDLSPADVDKALAACRTASGGEDPGSTAGP